LEYLPVRDELSCVIGRPSAMRDEEGDDKEEDEDTGASSEALRDSERRVIECSLRLTRGLGDMVNG
jgi:hypothetical protein